MVRVERVRHITPGANGIHLAVMDLQVSETSELPALNGIVDGMKVQAGSIAEIIQTGDYATLNTDGNWYAGGTEVS